MLNPTLARDAGWSARVSAVATILGFVTLIIFFMVGEPWGTLNDITSVILALSILPVLGTLQLLCRRNAPKRSLAAFIVGGIALLVAALFQTLLIFKLITFAQTAVVVPAAFGVFGASLIVFSLLGRANAALPRRLIWLGIVAGAGYVLVIAGILLAGQEHPITTIGGLIAVIAYPIWAIWFGQVLLSGKPITHSAD